MRARRASRRSGLVLAFLLASLGLILLLATALAQLVLLEVNSERRAALEDDARRIGLSAREWAQANIAQARAGATAELPISDLLPPGHTGRLTVTWEPAAGGWSVRCFLELARGRQDVRRAWRMPVFVPPAGLGPRAPAGVPAPR